MISLALLPFEVDPNVVKPGWTPLIILILLALAMVGLFISMRRQFRKIDTRRASGGFGPTDGANQSPELNRADEVDQPNELNRAEADVEPEPRRAAGPAA